MMTVYDAHAHAGEGTRESEIRLRCGIRTMLSCGNPTQAARGAVLCSAYPIYTMTAGIHPWYADQVRLSDMLPYMERAALVGEIGLDSVWCRVPMARQRRAFDAQLDWAAAHGKGIVLHTKGCEGEIARMVKGFPRPVLVHWYSGGEDALHAFLEMGCHFTIGPDVAQNPCVQAVARLVPDSRILFETDGMDAVRWAQGELPAERLPDVLRASVRTAAALRGQAPEHLLEYANGNFLRLL